MTIVSCLLLLQLSLSLSPSLSDPNFPRLAQMIVEFEHPIRRMSEEFQPISKVIQYLFIRLTHTLSCIVFTMYGITLFFRVHFCS